MPGDPSENGPRKQLRPGQPPGRRNRLLGSASRLPRRARFQARSAVRRRIPPSARDAFRADFAAMFLAGAYIGAIYPFMAMVARRELDASPLVLGLLAAAPFFGNLGALFWARAMEGRRKVPFVLWSHAVGRGLIFLMLFATGAWHFALIMAGVMIVTTIATPAYAAIIKMIYPGEMLGRIMSFTRAALQTANILATLLAGWLLTFVDFRFVFSAAGVLGIASAIVFSRINTHEQEVLAEEKPPKAAVGERLAETFRYLWETLGILKHDLGYRWFAASVLTYGFGMLLIMPVLPIVQVDHLGMHTDQLSRLVILGQAISIFAYFRWGRFVDRHSPQRAVVAAILLHVWLPVTYIAAIHVGEVWVLWPAFAIHGIVMAGIDLSYFNALLTFAGEKSVHRYQALQSFLLGTRGVVAPFIGSGIVTYLKAHDLNLSWAFALAIAFMLTGCALQVVAARVQEARRASR